jgi:hypothetical protein
VIKIVRGAEVDGPKGDDGRRRHGIRAYHAPAYPQVCGYSRQPLLDACRQLKSILGDTSVRVGLFREGSEVADISCTLKAGAATTVSETDRGGVQFVKYREVDFAKLFGRVPEHLADHASTEAA